MRLVSGAVVLADSRAGYQQGSMVRFSQSTEEPVRNDYTVRLM